MGNRVYKTESGQLYTVQVIRDQTLQFSAKQVEASLRKEMDARIKNQIDKFSSSDGKKNRKDSSVKKNDDKKKKKKKKPSDDDGSSEKLKDDVLGAFEDYKNSFLASANSSEGEGGGELLLQELDKNLERALEECIRGFRGRRSLLELWEFIEGRILESQLEESSDFRSKKLEDLNGMSRDARSLLLQKNTSLMERIKEMMNAVVEKMEDDDLQQMISKCELRIKRCESAMARFKTLKKSANSADAIAASSACTDAEAFYYLVACRMEVFNVNSGIHSTFLKAHKDLRKRVTEGRKNNALVLKEIEGIKGSAMGAAKSAYLEEMRKAWEATAKLFLQRITNGAKEKKLAMDFVEFYDGIKMGPELRDSVFNLAIEVIKFENQPAGRGGKGKGREAEVKLSDFTKDYGINYYLESMINMARHSIKFDRNNVDGAIELIIRMRGDSEKVETTKTDYMQEMEEKNPQRLRDDFARKQTVTEKWVLTERLKNAKEENKKKRMEQRENQEQRRIAAEREAKQKSADQRDSKVLEKQLEQNRYQELQSENPPPSSSSQESPFLSLYDIIMATEVTPENLRMKEILTSGGFFRRPSSPSVVPLDDVRREKPDGTWYLHESDEEMDYNDHYPVNFSQTSWPHGGGVIFYL